MRALLRYLILTGAIVCLGWASIAIDVDGRSLASHIRERGTAWLAELSEAREAKKDKATPKTKSKKTKKAVATKKKPAKKRPEREIPPTELQSEEGAKRRVALLAEAAKQAKSAEKPRSHATRVTPEQKKALDALLTNRQSSD